MTMITKDDILKELKYYHHYSGFKYIARDKNGTLYLYRDEPHKEYGCWIDTHPSATNFLPHKWPFYYENEVFDMITWDDEMPTPIWDVIDQLEHLDIDRPIGSTCRRITYQPQEEEINNWLREGKICFQLPYYRDTYVITDYTDILTESQRESLTPILKAYKGRAPMIGMITSTEDGVRYYNLEIHLDYSDELKYAEPTRYKQGKGSIILLREYYDNTLEYLPPLIASWRMYEPVQLGIEL